MQSVNRGAEQLPLSDLTKFEQARIGDVVIAPPTEGRVTVMQILAIQDSPITVDRAQPIIQQYLVNSRNAKALDEHLHLNVLIILDRDVSAHCRAFGKCTFEFDTEPSAKLLR